MAAAVSKIKGRIKSVSGAYKVTSAMKLVSTSRLKKYRNKMLNFKDYTDEIEKTISLLLAVSNKIKSPFFEQDDHIKKNKNLYIIVSSTLGLCGSYNNNIFLLAESSIKETDDAIILGKKGISHFKDGKFTKVENFDEYRSSYFEGAINSLSNYVNNEFLKGTYDSVYIIYSSYKNPVTFIPKDLKLLPLNNKNEENNEAFATIFEPNPQKLAETLIPYYLTLNLKSKLLESEVCEQAARSNAMENATSNAKEILDELEIEFNKARQGAITQEIIEIVSASKSV
ncbi:MAG: ATP synthase F1 subunit gamma [Bacilli bacterium]|nr:ATP synthase F1 subunit gamma [Bacilli bacterium]